MNNRGIPAPQRTVGHAGLLVRLARVAQGVFWFASAARIRSAKSLNSWRRRERDLAELRELPDRELRDIGLTRADVMRETGKPIWRR